jgi:hypothetical protein
MYVTGNFVRIDDVVGLSSSSYLNWKSRVGAVALYTVSRQYCLSIGNGDFGLQRIKTLKPSDTKTGTIDYVIEVTKCA